MSVESDAVADERPAVESMGHELGEAIAELPEYEAFEAAREAVQADDEAQELIRAFEQQRQSFMLARQTGQADEEQLQEVQAAQDELVDRLEDVNRAISAPLAIDFGGEAGGCCHD